MCLKSNSDVYGLRSHLEQISSIRTPSDFCALKEFWVRTYFLSGALLNTVGQVAPSWCLLSSACQFWIGIPKSHFPGIFDARAAAS